MDSIKDLIAVVFGGRLLIDGRDRTFAKLPLWLAVLAGLASPQLAIITAVLVVAFGMHARIVKA